MNKAFLVKVLNVVRYLAVYYLSVKMICFAIPKFLFMQFRMLHYKLFIPLVETSKYEHMWSFFGRSHNYNLFIGSVEFLIGVLIVFRRTRLIALLMSIGLCLNILILNIEYEIHFAITHISFDLILTILLLLDYRKDLYGFFIELGGKLKNQAPATNSVFLRRLPYVYLLVFPIGYFIFAYQLKSGINEEMVGSYKINSLEVGNTNMEIRKGKLGSSPLIFFEHNNQAVLSVNDSVYYGAYLIDKDKIKILFYPSVNQKIRKIEGRFKNNSLLEGRVNDSTSIKMEVERLPAEKDYLNTLYAH